MVNYKIFYWKNCLDLTSIEKIWKFRASLRLALNMSQIDRLLSEAKMTTGEPTQVESNFTEVRNERKQLRKQMPTPIDNVRPIIVSFDPRPSQIQFARAIRSNFPIVKTKQMSELKNSCNFFIQLENLAPRESLMLSLNPNQSFPNAKVNARNAPSRPKTKLIFVIVSVHHSVTEDEEKEWILNKNWRNVTKE